MLPLKVEDFYYNRVKFEWVTWSIEVCHTTDIIVQIGFNKYIKQKP